MIRAWLLFISVSVTVAFFLSSLRTLISGAGLSTWIAAVSLICGALISQFFSKGLFRRWVATFWLRADSLSRFLVLFLFLFSSMSFFLLYGEYGGNWRTANPNNLGDLPYHLHLIESFKREASFPPMDPTFAGERLHYPYGMDLWDALWVKTGLPVEAAFALTGVLSLFVSLYALWKLGDLVLVFAFVFGGSVVLSFDWNRTFGPVAPLPWKSLFHAVFVTQRGFLFALPAGIFLISKWLRFVEEKDYRLSNSFFWIWAVLPFFHLHTFAILTLWMVLAWAFGPRRWDLRLIPTALVSVILLFRSVNFGKMQSSIALHWGWMFETWLGVWNCFGPWLLVPVYVSYRWIQKKQWANLAIAFVLTFIVINVRLAPWVWDNIKVIFWVYLLWTFWFVREFQWKGRSAAIIGFFLFWPGFFHWVSGWPSMTGQFSTTDAVQRAVVEKMLESISPNDVLMVKMDHQHPIFGLGQRLMFSHPGLAFSHGYFYDDRVRAQDGAFTGVAETPERLQQFNVKWVLWRDGAETDSLPIQTWLDWGWVEHDRRGEWHLWKIQN